MRKRAIQVDLLGFVNIEVLTQVHGFLNRMYSLITFGKLDVKDVKDYMAIFFSHVCFICPVSASQQTNLRLHLASQVVYFSLRNECKNLSHLEHNQYLLSHQGRPSFALQASVNVPWVDQLFHQLFFFCLG